MGLQLRDEEPTTSGAGASSAGAGASAGRAGDITGDDAFVVCVKCKDFARGLHLLCKTHGSVRRAQLHDHPFVAM